MSVEAIFFFGTLLILFLAIVLVAYVMQFNKRQNNYFKTEQALLQSQLEIQEQTFKTISQELNDNIGQVYTLPNLIVN